MPDRTYTASSRLERFGLAPHQLSCDAAVTVMMRTFCAPSQGDAMGVGCDTAFPALQHVVEGCVYTRAGEFRPLDPNLPAWSRYRGQLPHGALTTNGTTSEGHQLDYQRAPFGGQRLLWRMASVIALLTALGGVLSACGFSNTFNYGHGQGQCENCGSSN